MHTDKYVCMFELIHTYLNTGMSARMSMAPSGAATRPVLLNEREKLETEVLRQLLEYYFKIVRESITDSVPKAIMLKLVRVAAPVLWSPVLTRLIRFQSVDLLPTGVTCGQSISRPCACPMLFLSSPCCVWCEFVHEC